MLEQVSATLPCQDCSAVDGSLDVQSRGIEHRQIWPVFLLDEQRDLRTAKNDALGATSFQLVDDIEIGCFRRAGELPPAKLVEDDSIDNGLFVRAGRHDAHTELVSIPLDEEVR